MGRRTAVRHENWFNAMSLFQELRHAFDEESTLSGKSRLLLSIAVPADEEKINDGYDVPVVSKLVVIFYM